MPGFSGAPLNEEKSLDYSYVTNTNGTMTARDGRINSEIGLHDIDASLAVRDLNSELREKVKLLKNEH